ncbi:hypothetical protein PR202_gb15661 [Eleusine coracana subsp. coracana]|uniref:Uncharacterized protein n=1 Tax=Eleusine coracana subsp. coracana TaxID=191504 RepID=A0AAV5EYX7_ELECO|nr:hypothetical protein PR202_gb15661 [Eleusine coracana subsp. coracana]
MSRGSWQRSQGHGGWGVGGRDGTSGVAAAGVLGVVAAPVGERQRRNGRFKAIETNNMNPQVTKRFRQMEAADSIAGSGVRLQVLAYHNNEPSFHTPSPGAWQIQAFHALGPSEVSEGWNFQQGQRKVAKLILQREFHPFGIPMFSIPLHCDGLVLISCITGKAFMCNPSTREFVELPPDSTNVASDHRVAFGFDPWSGDNNQAWEWKLTMDPPYPIKARTPICLSGSFYWSALQSMADDKVPGGGRRCRVRPWRHRSWGRRRRSRGARDARARIRRPGLSDRCYKTTPELGKKAEVVGRTGAKELREGHRRGRRR